MRAAELAELVVVKLGETAVFRVRQKNLEKLKTSISTKLKKSLQKVPRKLRNRVSKNFLELRKLDN